MILPRPIQNLADSLAQLPGLGPRQALRLTFWLLHQPPEKQTDLTTHLNDLFSKIKLCTDCFFPFEAKNEETLCEICRNPQRDHTIICVVEKKLIYYL